MNKSRLLAYVLAGWLIVEIVAFVLVVELLGVLAAVALGVGTTLIGLADVKRLFAYLRARMTKNGETRPGPGLLEGSLEAAGCILLILPGFASDLVGLALKAPSVRANVADRLRGRQARQGPQTIDLAPGEWRQIDEQRKRRVRPRAPSAPRRATARDGV